jgi:hypothetical protein
MGAELSGSSAQAGLKGCVSKRRSSVRDAPCNRRLASHTRQQCGMHRLSADKGVSVVHPTVVASGATVVLCG